MLFMEQLKLMQRMVQMQKIKLMNMSLKELLEKSSTGSDKTDREIRFVSPGQFLEPMSIEEWDKH